MPETQQLPSSNELKQWIRDQGRELGFQQVGFTNTELGEHLEHYRRWLDKGFHGDMQYMAERESLRADVQQLVPGTLSVITVRLNYVPQPARFADSLQDASKANISRYALGRDYHKLMRKKLAKLAEQIRSKTDQLEYRVFVDSAPVLERAYAEKSGQGWIGKNTMLINEHEGSFFFIGELLTNLPFDADEQQPNLCGECRSCIQICPTQAIVAPYSLDARRCISYLTIEHHGSIDPSLRPLMGNRIYGCDDCQLVCPWNRYATNTSETDFLPRNQFDDIDLLSLFAWDEATFLRQTEGSAIRRIGHERWQRNIAVALGNAHYADEIFDALQQCLHQSDSELVREHVAWAIEQQLEKKQSSANLQTDKLTQKLIRSTIKITQHLD